MNLFKKAADKIEAVIRPLRNNYYSPRVYMTDYSVDFLRAHGVSDYDIGRIDAYFELASEYDWYKRNNLDFESNMIYRLSMIENAYCVGVAWKKCEHTEERKY